MPSEGGSTPAATVDITPIVNELKNINNELINLNYKEYDLYLSKDSYIKDIAGKLFSNVSFDTDRRPYKEIAHECIEKATILANYLYTTSVSSSIIYGPDSIEGKQTERPNYVSRKQNNKSTIAYIELVIRQNEKSDPYYFYVKL